MAQNDTYVALEDLYVARGVRAFNKGAVVPQDNAYAAQWHKDGLLARPSAQVAKQAQADATEA